MAYTMQVEGLEDLSRKLTQAGEKAQAIAAMGLYDGAGAMADEIKNAADSIKTSKFHYAVFPPTVQRDPTPEEKAVVLSASAGIAKFNTNGSEVNTSVGYSNAGYAQLNGKQVPIPKIANAINSGTSFMKKQPFFRKAVSSGTQKASQKIVSKIEDAINQMIK